MAAALVVSLETPLPEATTAYVKAGPGKALARESERLDYAAKCAKTTAITSLLSESTAALVAQLKEDGFDPSKMRLPPERWFPAADGLAAVRNLHAYVTEKLNDFKQPNAILRDLKAAEGLLTAAEAAGIKFHFTKANV